MNITWHGMRAAGVLAATLATWSASSFAADPPVIPGGTITVRAGSPWDCFDPGKCLGSGTLAAQYATLLSIDPSGKALPYLAKSWQVTPTSITFTLRDDATCADGTKVTPAVVKASYQRLIDIKAKNNPANWGPGPYSVSSDDKAGTFTFKTETPYSDLIYGFGDVYPGVQTAVVCPAGYANPDEKMTTKSFGAGPYVITEAVSGDHVTVKLRPDFAWGPNGVTAKTPGVPDTVIYKVVVNQSTAANLLLTGGLDVAPILGPDVARMISEKSLLHTTTYSTLFTHLHFNESPGRVTADKTVRQALITAIDPKAVNQAETTGRGKLGPSWITPGMSCFDAATEALAPQPSVEKARAVLLADGWTMSGGKLTKGGKPLTVRLTYPDLFGPGPEYVQAQWTQMGAEVVLNGSPMTRWVEDSYFNGNFDAAFNQPASPLPLYGSWKSRLSGAVPPTGTNWPRSQDPVLESEGNAATATIGEESCKHWAAFQEQLWQGWHILPFYSYPLDAFSRDIDVSHGIAGTSDVGISPISMRRIKR